VGRPSGPGSEWEDWGDWTPEDDWGHGIRTPDGIPPDEAAYLRREERRKYDPFIVGLAADPAVLSQTNIWSQPMVAMLEIWL
jgi:hypothetical protein